MAPPPYRVRQPRSLETWATEALASWIASEPERLLSPTFELLRRDPPRAEQLISRQIKISRNYLKTNLPWKFHDTLAIEVIEKLQIAMKTRIQYYTTNVTKTVTEQKLIGRMIVILFTRNLTSLSFHTVKKRYFMKAFLDALLFKSYKLTGLSRLDLCNGFLEEIDLIMFLKELHNLKHLSIDNCSHNVIRCIAENCKLLEDLESWDEKNINRESIDLLKDLYNLRSIFLMNTICEKGIETLLLCHKNVEIKLHLEYLEEPYNLERGLEHIASSRKHAGKQFNLKNYVCSSAITLQQFKVVVKMCPFIQELDLYKTDPIQFHISPLLELQHLRKLVLHRFHFYTNRLIDVLQVRGSNLIHLRFEDDIELDLNALICVSQTCPNLESLYIKNCDLQNFQKQSSAYDLVNSKNIVLESMTFRKLKRLTYKDIFWINDPKKELFFLLASCPNVQFINVDNYHHPITDNFMLRVLDRNPMIYLQELKLTYEIVYPGDRTYNGQITHETTHPQPMLFIDRIIKNCVKSPEITISYLACKKHYNSDSELDSE